MFSPRALAYLRTLERRPHVEDLNLVRQALLRSGVPRNDAFLELHQALAGYVELGGRDKFVYGIIHYKTSWYDRLEPNVSDYEGRWYASYTDAHPSYERDMDDIGVLYQAGGVRRARSFRSFIEQHAFIAGFWETGAITDHDIRVPPEAAAQLRERLEQHRAVDLGDGISDVWATPGWCLLGLEDTSFRLWSLEGAPLGELTEFVR